VRNVDGPALNRPRFSCSLATGVRRGEVLALRAARWDPERWRPAMRSVKLDIPEEILEEVRNPPSERESTLLRELAVHLYARELLPKAAARKLSGMDRIAFDDLLGQRGITSRLSVEDVSADLRSLDAWREPSGSKAGNPEGPA
jgi:predicted HTH domain antitoxin